MCTNFIITNGGGGYPCSSLSFMSGPGSSATVSSCVGYMTTVVTSGNGPFTYSWSNGATTANLTNLCPGTYCVTVTDVNGCTATICSVIHELDTLTIFGASCPNPIDTLISYTEDCTVDYGAIDTAYLSSAVFPSIPGDTIVTTWNLVDTNGVITPILGYFTGGQNVVGCYYFIFSVYCYNKSNDTHILNIKQGFYIDQFSGIEELLIEKELIKITDLMGRECNENDGEILLYHFNNGEVKRIYKNK